MHWALFCTIFFVSYVQGARILGVFHIPSISHQCVFQPIWKELSLRGHEVIVVTPNPLKDPSLTNLTEIDVSYTYDIIKRHDFQAFMSIESPITTKIPKIFHLNNDVAEAVFQNEQFKKIYDDPTQKFDLILTQCWVSPIMFSLAAKFGAPVIGVSSMGAWVGAHYAAGNPNPPALYSEMFLPFHGNMNFWERLRSSFYALWSRYYIHYHAHPEGDRIVKKYLGKNLPYLGESERNVSMYFLNTNPILYTPRPTVPTVIPLGQMHIQPSKPLPSDLKKLLDDAKEGVVYFSLGSNVKSVNIPEHIRTILIQTFSELPYTVLWKWEADQMPGKPKNVIIRKWLPQQDVLAHPNVKVFVTQCGLQSIEESVSRGVPMVGIPFVADQEMNIRKLAEFEVAIGVDYATMTKDQLKGAIKEVAGNKKYRNKVQEFRNILKDQPMTGLERAVWWSEYVIRHKGTRHLRSPTADISWFHFLLLDVIGVLLFVLLSFIFVATKCIKFITLTSKTKEKKN